jgi:hypothetical protein
LAALTWLLAGLLLVLIRLLLATTLLSSLTWLLVRLSALILIILGHNYLQLECELSRDGQLPARVLCSLPRNIIKVFDGVMVAT